MKGLLRTTEHCAGLCKANTASLVTRCSSERPSCRFMVLFYLRCLSFPEQDARSCLQRWTRTRELRTAFCAWALLFSGSYKMMCFMPLPACSHRLLFWKGATGAFRVMCSSKFVFFFEWQRASRFHLATLSNREDQPLTHSGSDGQAEPSSWAPHKWKKSS